MYQTWEWNRDKQQGVLVQCREYLLSLLCTTVYPKTFCWRAGTSTALAASSRAMIYCS